MPQMSRNSKQFMQLECLQCDGQDRERNTMTTKSLQVQRENLEKENNALKADLDQMHGLQEQYEQLQEKVCLH